MASKSGLVKATPSHPDEDRYRAEDDLRTLSRADEIRADQRRMGNVRKVHQDQQRSLQRVGKSIAVRPTGRKKSPRRRAVTGR